MYISESFIFNTCLRRGIYFPRKSQILRDTQKKTKNETVCLLNLTPCHEDVRINLHAFLPWKLVAASDKILKA